MKKHIEIFDSTLRDGAQGENISFSVEDKIKIVKTLDKFGVDYIEAGNPGSNQKDLEFFEKIQDMELAHAKLVAFGSTRRKGISVEEDSNVQSLLKAKTQAVAIFGKSWDFHATDIIKCTLEENLCMIQETIFFFKGLGKEVVFDAEHFFDGFKNNKGYALLSLKAALDGGADSLALCDTNGGCLPSEIFDITKEVKSNFPNAKIGIHCHNDGGMAVANSITSVEAGAEHIQGTFLGFGERSGNANLAVIIPSLQVKKDFDCVPTENLKELTSVAKTIAEISNVTIENTMPYVGKSAFAHKGGMHIDGVSKAAHSFEHMNPEEIGNERRFLMSEVSGRSTILKRIQKVDPKITKTCPVTQEVIDVLKQMEYEGYQFEGAESSFELLIRKILGVYKPFFKLDYYKIIDDDTQGMEKHSSVVIKIVVDGKAELTAAEGNGPVNALDKALRKALEVFYPELKKVHLTDYKVRVLDTENATASKVRVLIESTDGYNKWSTVGVSTDVVKASWIALVDSIEHKLMKDYEAQINTESGVIS